MSDHWAQKRGMSYLLRALETHVTWNLNYKTLNLHWIYILTYSGGCSVPAGIEFVYLLHTKSLKGWWWNKYNSWYTGLWEGSEWGRILYLLHCTACHHLGKGQIIYNKGFLGSTLKIHHTTPTLWAMMVGTLKKNGSKLYCGELSLCWKCWLVLSPICCSVPFFSLKRTQSRFHQQLQALTFQQGSVTRGQPRQLHCAHSLST